jgi:hypothetical protein
MRLTPLVTGALCLGLSGYLAWWAWQNKVFYQKIVRPGPQTVKAADLIANGPGAGHSVHITDAVVGEPVVREAGQGQPRELWFPVYPKPPRGEKVTGPPRVLLHTQNVSTN